MWDQIRELTLKSNAPACVYEEGDIIKRAIRDLYNKDVSEIFVEGEEGYKNAKEFMRMLMPSHAKNVKPYRDPVPVFPEASHRGAAGRDVPAHRDAEIRRLHRHQPDRGAGLHRRELRPRHARALHRRDRAQDQSRSGGRSRPPAAAARSGRPHRHRLHRHGRRRATTATSRSGCATR